MNTLEKFKALKKEQSEKQLAELKKAKEQQQYNRNECKILYHKFIEMIHPFNGQIINNFKITLKFHPKTLAIDLYLNKKFCTTFIAECEYNPCNCSECHDGQTGHEGSYSYHLNSYTNNKDKTFGPYFPFYHPYDEDTFVHDLDRFLTECAYNEKCKT